MRKEDVIAVLRACKPLADKLGRLGRFTLDDVEQQLLLAYRAVHEAGWLDEAYEADSLRRAAGLLRSDLGLLTYQLDQQDVARDPEGVLARIRERFGISAAGPAKHGQPTIPPEIAAALVAAYGGRTVQFAADDPIGAPADLLGQTGSTGYSAGTHLHLMIQAGLAPGLIPGPPFPPTDPTDESEAD